MSVVERFQQLEAHASSLIIGQSHLINRMLIALLCDGHLLVEGAPGLAKTRLVDTAGITESEDLVERLKHRGALP